MLLDPELPVEKAAKDAGLDDDDNYQGDFVGEDVEVHLPEDLPAPPELHVSLDQPAGYV